MTLYRLLAVLEVRGSLQPHMVLFSSGEQVDEEELCGAQSLDALLEGFPKHPLRYTLRKDFNGEALLSVCAWGFLV